MLTVLLVLGWAGADPPVNPRYILMNMPLGDVPSFADQGFGELNPSSPHLRVGVSTLFDLLNDDANGGLVAIEQLLASTAASRIPVFFGLDGENWWARSNLSNWWDSGAAGYDPANRHNVEWTGPDGGANDNHVLKISWRNWGRQLRVAPQQNLHSPVVMAAYRRALQKVVPVIVQWYNGLPAADKWLFAGIKGTRTTTQTVTGSPGSRTSRTTPASTRIHPAGTTAPGRTAT